MPLQLTVLEGPSTGQKFLVEQAGAFLVGRAAGASFALRGEGKPDRRISKHHALIEFNYPRCRIYNLSDKNQLLVNGSSIENRDLGDGDRIVLGRTTFQVRISSPPEATPLPLSETTALLSPSLPTSSETSAEIAIITGKCPICGQASSEAASPLCSSCEASAKGLRQSLDSYRLVKSLGIDHLGQTYKAINHSTKRPVIVRTIQPAGILPTPVSLHFLKELRRVQGIRHRHLVKIEEVSLSNGIFFVVSKMIRGVNLVQWTKKKQAVKTAFAVGVACQILSGLKTLHEQGCVHGDLRATNVLLKPGEDRELLVKITDVGLDAVFRHWQIGGSVLPSEEQNKIIWRAPEQIVDGAKTGPASDQYSVAAMLYYMLTGHRIFKPAKDPRDHLLQKLAVEPTSIRQYRPDLPTRLISAIHCALARDPKRRFADVQQFRAALKGFLK